MDTSYLNVKRIRKAQGFSLREFSKRCGLSVSYLSNYENGKVNISLASLYEMARALDVSIKTLLAAEQENAIFVVTRENRFPMIKSKCQYGNVVQELLSRGASFDMQATVMHLPEFTDSGLLDCHDGQELVFMIRGSIVLIFNGEHEYGLNEGDMAYYDAHVSHCWKNENDKPAEFLAVASKSVF